MHTLRLIGVIVCAGLAVASFVYAVVALTESWARGFGTYLVWAGLLGGAAALLWCRASWRRVGTAFGLWVLGSVALYIVIVELHGHGYLQGGP